MPSRLNLQDLKFDPLVKGKSYGKIYPVFHHKRRKKPHQLPPSLINHPKLRTFSHMKRLRIQTLSLFLQRNSLAYYMFERLWLLAASIISHISILTRPIHLGIQVTLVRPRQPRREGLA